MRRRDHIRRILISGFVHTNTRGTVVKLAVVIITIIAVSDDEITGVPIPWVVVPISGQANLLAAVDMDETASL